jgi:hypothetical protein
MSMPSSGYSNGFAAGTLASLAQTWLGRSIAKPRSRYGYILCPGAGLDVLGRRYSVSMHIRRIIVRTSSRPITTPLATQQIAQHSAARKRIVQVQRINPPHDCQLRRRHRLWLIIQLAPAEPQ